MSLQENIQQTLLLGGRRVSFGNNDPAQYSGKQFEYFADPTKMFREKMLEYANDFFLGLLERLDKGGVWEEQYLRLAEVVRPSAAGTNEFDDKKIAMFRDPALTYVMPGTKLQAAGSTWLAVNPMNISGGEGVTIFRRCNTVWNHLDFYGNVVSEPIAFEPDWANASSPDAQTEHRVSTGYYKITAQWNDFTRQINDNSRVILGSKAYQVTGYGDFDQEFTGDYDTVRIVKFAVRVLTKNEETDDMENHVAGGKTFRWEISVDGPDLLDMGETAVLAPVSRRNGETVSSRLENPVSYVFSSSDPAVLTVQSDGTVTAVSTGTAAVTVSLAQNPAISTSLEISVESGFTGVRFVKKPPVSVGAYQSFEAEAAAFVNGKRRADTISWALSGAEAGSYNYTADGNRVAVSCFGYSETPLTVTASSGGQEASESVILEGF